MCLQCIEPGTLGYVFRTPILLNISFKYLIYCLNITAFGERNCADGCE